MYRFSDDVLALNPELRDFIAKPARRGAKYGNVPTVVDGIRFHSGKEAMDYIGLKLLADAGEIEAFELQPEFELQPGYIDAGGRTVQPIRYIADFRWVDPRTRRIHVRDSKGYQTKDFKIKRKMFERLYPDIVFEVG